MMILTSTSRWEFRGGPHGEALTSHDQKKDQQEGGTEGEAETTEPEICREEAFTEDRRRQNRTSSQSADESTLGQGEFGMTEASPNLPKTGGQVAKVLGNLTNDPRITNLLMLVIIAVGMGVHESVQTQLCSL